MRLLVLPIAVLLLPERAFGLRLPVRAAARVRRTAPPTLSAEPPKLSQLRELEADLASAVREERYGDAAALRDRLSSLSLDSETAVLSANADFYRCFSEHDTEGMEALWLRADEIACIHPGHAPIYGFADVQRSWTQIFGEPAFEVKAEKVRCRVRDGVARVSCLECIGDNQLVATNIFELDEGGRWKMVLHQAGPCMVQAGDN